MSFWEEFWKILKVTMPVPQSYGWFHLLSFALSIAAAVVLCVLYQKGIYRNVRRVVLVTAVTTPFVAATTALLHLDLRMRKEAYDVELIQQAGLGQR